MVAIVDFGMCNLRSVQKALELVGADALVTRNAEDIKRADRIVLPGVGSFARGMQQLCELNLANLLYEQVVLGKKPFLGICLGMQLTAATGQEHGVTKGLGWFDAVVEDLNLTAKNVKVPHIGWNDVEFVKDTPLFKGLNSPATFYFAHSYHFIPDTAGMVTGLCNHGSMFVASISLDNIHLVQFHPEKSQRDGLQVLDNFLSY